MGPVKEFNERLRYNMSLRFQKVEGMTEINSLEANERFLREAKSPKHEGLIQPKRKKERKSWIDPNSFHGNHLAAILLQEISF